MQSLSKLPALLILSAALSAGSAQADVLDLSGLVGKANLYSLSNISLSNNSVAGGIVANGNVSGSGYSVGTGAYGNYSVIASGNFSYSNGQLAGGYYAGSTNIAANTNLSHTPASAAPAMSFATTSNNVAKTSSAIAALSSTGRAQVLNTYSPNQVTLTSGAGGAKSVEVFNMTSSAFASINNLQSTLDSSVTKTLIFNLTGNANWNNMGMSALNGYNVLFNFVDATSVNFSGIDVLGSVLAPKAVIGGGNGIIEGTVVAGGWNSNLTLNNKAFAATDVTGFAAAVSPVPEPGTWAMLLAGLGLLGFAARRRMDKAAA
ncbi:choice-of-anchor A family protein [Janthinobacterium sp. RB2R34]|uniref:choice-of-anchor A family protein n=1 Tax=Janthinobacterium sp. RB2R34 TaxID=3424193 RepID=UPI003F25ADED